MPANERTRLRVSPETVLLALIVIYFVFLLRSDWVMLIGLKDEKMKLERETAAALKDRDRLNKDIRLLDDPSYLEVLSREKLGLIKAGEVPYKVVR